MSSPAVEKKDIQRSCEVSVGRSDEMLPEADLPIDVLSGDTCEPNKRIQCTLWFDREEVFEEGERVFQ